LYARAAVARSSRNKLPVDDVYEGLYFSFKEEGELAMLRKMSAWVLFFGIGSMLY
jgi:hypothetical protein